MRKKKLVLEEEVERDSDEDAEDEGEATKKVASSGSMRLGEFGSAVLQLAEEKGISEDKVIEVVEAALAAAYKKDYGKRGQVIRAEFDRETKAARYFLVKEVVDETMREFVAEGEEEDGAEFAESRETKKLSKDHESEKPEKTRKTKKSEEAKEETSSASAEGGDASSEEGAGSEAELEVEKLPRFNSDRDMTLEEAHAVRKDAALGDMIDIELESKQEFGRVAAQTAKQVIIQRIREAERESMFAEYKSKEGTIVNGVVQRIDGRIVFVDLGKSVGALFPSEQMEGEHYRIGQRLKVFLLRVEADAKGPGITLSRAHAEMVKHLFTLEVPEIFSGVVEIKRIAREAGSRTKIAVATAEEGVDPIGSCVGQKGTRVQAVIDELGGEKIDIIEWSEDAEKFIKAALSPAKVSRVEFDEAGTNALVHVPEDQLSLAIGRKGQNVRLASKLTGFRIDIAGSGTRKASQQTTDEEKQTTDNEQLTTEEEQGVGDGEQQTTDNKQLTTGGEEQGTTDNEQRASEGE